jgi:STE24 endopeptidase
MEQAIVSLFLVFFGIEFLVEIVLNELNLRHVRAQRADKQIPDFFRGRISPEEYEKSVDYTLAKGRFQRWAEIYGRLVILVILFSGLLGFFDHFAASVAQRFSLGVYGHGIAFCLTVALYLTITGLVTDVYSTFVLEAKFGFNKMTVALFVSDKLKALLLGLLIGIPFLWVILWLMQAAGSFWWLWAFAFVSGFQLLMIVVFPTFIAPWFNKFEPLKEGEFRARILALAEQVGFKTSGIFSMDGSKRSAHSNAYFTGIGKSKRIVLFDTLLDQMSMEQGLAVLAHEMGHYKMKHIQRMLVVQTIFLLAGLYALSRLLDFQPLYTAFRLAPSHHVALVLFSLLSGAMIFYLGPLMHLLSRKHEYEADRFAALTLRDGKAMEEALINLTVKNLSNLTPHPWYSAYHYSHPTPTERIRAIRQCTA